ncbi:MAG: DUF2807 domain-containing protein [Bacteroidales bacterium]|nr:DUF2807 domain-containing protein [Bacteroidales bacterium]MDD2203719.1 DUF2807 domain-containing protein [Bacteroidales bacterium]MDD3913343.1 DUF2807 domain-containing protein [Bacteroidales bacterium]MDD4633374.1 DUF2807 domain-containing protein [Bacteroidales bacterium]
MKKLFLSALTVLLIFVCFTSCVKNPGETLQNNYFENSNIRSIEIASGWKVVVEQSNTSNYVVLEYSDAISDKIIVKLENGNLKLELKYCSFSCIDMEMNATIYVTTLESIELSGASEVVISGTFQVDDLNIEMSGASELSGGVFTASSIDVDLSGASYLKNMYLSGNDCEITASGDSYIEAVFDVSDEMDVNLSGASDLYNDATSDLQHADLSLEGASKVEMINQAVETLDVSFSGASEARVNVINVITGRLSGSSDLYYYGNPTTDVNCSGGSAIHKL